MSGLQSCIELSCSSIRLIFTEKCHELVFLRWTMTVLFLSKEFVHLQTPAHVKRLLSPPLSCLEVSVSVFQSWRLAETMQDSRRQLLPGCQPCDEHPAWHMVTPQKVLESSLGLSQVWVLSCHDQTRGCGWLHHSDGQTNPSNAARITCSI